MDSMPVCLFAGLSATVIHSGTAKAVVMKFGDVDVDVDGLAWNLRAPNISKIKYSFW